jgi:hypothetical protein
MVVDPHLLEQARDAGGRLDTAERDACLARADYNTAIRRLHLGGASLREIAQALSISHQRVQQVVSAAGGSWWQLWRKRSEARDAVCSWCNRSPREVQKLIAGPKVYICDACVEANQGAVRKRDFGPGRHHRCDFCRKRAGADRAVVAGPPNVCSDCLRVCREILDSRAV